MLWKNIRIAKKTFIANKTQSSNHKNEEALKLINNKKKTNSILKKKIKLNENNSTVVNPTDISNMYNQYYTHLSD